MWDSQTIMMIVEGTGVTLYMTLVSTLIAYALGIPMGITLVVTAPGGLKPIKIIYKILDVVVNIVRSIPFLILLMLIIPFTRLIVGKSYGATATIVPLAIAAAPFVARLVESSLLEVDHGVIEAAQSMGASLWTLSGKCLGRGQDIPDSGGYHFPWHNPRLFGNGRRSRRRRSWRHCHPLRVLQMARRYYDCDGNSSGGPGANPADDWDKAFKEAGQKDYGLDR